jgi:olefin beta-lactone synthetase
MKSTTTKTLPLNIADRLDRLANETPQKPAIIFAAGTNRWETCSYGQLRARTAQIAAQLRASGLRAGTRAVVLVPPSIDFVALAYAMLKTGVVPVLIDPAIGLRNVTRCLEEASPQVFIGNLLTHSLRAIFGWGKSSVRLNILMSSLLRAAKAAGDVAASHPVASDTEAAIIFTSGSTGLAKGAVYTHGNFAAVLDTLVKSFAIETDEVDLPAFPLFLMIDCLLGVTAVVPDMRFPAPARTNASKVIAAANQFRVTNIFASPVVLDRLSSYAHQHGVCLETVKRAITAGAPVPARVLAAFSKALTREARVLGIYGATEALVMSVVDAKTVLGKAKSKAARGAGICVGKPVAEARIRIMAISDDPVAEWRENLEVRNGQVGEITVMGPHVTREYWGRADANAQAKMLERGKIVHRTGDLGYFDEHGLLWYCGRKAHRVVTSAGTVFTEQIEGIFNAHPAVYRSALVGLRGEPVLWIELERAAKTIDRRRLLAELRDLAAGHEEASQIRRYLFLSRFPTDVRHNSKIIREKLARMAEKKLK